MSEQLEWGDKAWSSARTQRFFKPGRKRAVVSYKRFQHQKGQKARINLRVEADLVAWVKAFAKSQDVTMTSLVVDYFLTLRKDYGGAPPMVEQI